MSTLSAKSIYMGLFSIIAAFTFDSLVPGFADKNSVFFPETVPHPAPSRTETVLKLGIRKFQAGDMVESEKLFKSVLAIDHTNTTAYFNLGVIAESRGDLPGALQNYQAALQTRPDDRQLQEAVTQISSRLTANNNVFSENQSNQIVVNPNRRDQSHLKKRLFNAALGIGLSTMGMSTVRDSCSGCRL